MAGTLEIHRKLKAINGDSSIENFIYCRSEDCLKVIDLGACQEDGRDCCLFKIQWLEPERLVARGAEQAAFLEECGDEEWTGEEDSAGEFFDSVDEWGGRGT